MHKRFFPILLLLLAVVGCNSHSTPPEHIALAQEPAFYPPVETDIKQVFKDVPRIQPQDVYQEYDGLKVVQFTVYSSGKIEQMTVNQMTFPVLWVYDPTRKDVVQYPMVLAIPEDDGRCVPFYQPAYDPPAEWQDCQIYLQDIQGVIQRGQLLFPALAGDYVNPTGIDWVACGQAAYCLMGTYYQAVYQDYDMDRNILQRSLSRVPSGWALAWTWGAGEASINLPGGKP
ncbi:MAG: hypothetical protein ANABAC_1311 [Anaerolineae bacterium]|nr:MAG: hypothetical protein ANABAC_1311 [Anaerolineae bacterium]